MQTEISEHQRERSQTPKLFCLMGTTVEIALPQLHHYLSFPGYLTQIAKFASHTWDTYKAVEQEDHRRASALWAELMLLRAAAFSSLQQTAAPGSRSTRNLLTQKLQTKPTDPTEQHREAEKKIAPPAWNSDFQSGQAGAQSSGRWGKTFFITRSERDFWKPVPFYSTRHKPRRTARHPQGRGPPAGAGFRNGGAPGQRGSRRAPRTALRTPIPATRSADLTSLTPPGRPRGSALPGPPSSLPALPRPARWARRRRVASAPPERGSGPSPAGTGRGPRANAAGGTLPLSKCGASRGTPGRPRRSAAAAHRELRGQGSLLPPPCPGITGN